MVEEKPTAAFVLSLIGAIFQLLFSIIIIGVGAFFALFLIGGVLVWGIIGMVLSIIVLIGAIILYVNPRQHLVWGILILIFSIINFVFTFGGFIIGSILGIVGGALGIVWKPKAAPVIPPPPPPPSSPTPT
jgi:hypothetical protein